MIPAEHAACRAAGLSALRARPRCGRSRGRRARAVARLSTRSCPTRAHCRRCSPSPRSAPRAPTCSTTCPPRSCSFPWSAPVGHGAVLAMLIGVGVGPESHLHRFAGHAAVAPGACMPTIEDTDALRVPRARCAHRPRRTGGVDARLVVGSAGDAMRAVIWIAESTWETCVGGGSSAAARPGCDHARARRATDAEAVADRRARSPARTPAPSPRRAGAGDALARGGHGAAGARPRAPGPRGRAGGAARAPRTSSSSRPRGAPTCSCSPATGRRWPDPGASAPRARFVLDHAPCPVLLVPGTEGPLPPVRRPAIHRYRLTGR